MSKHLLLISIFFTFLFVFCHSPKKMATKQSYISLTETPLTPTQLAYSFQLFFDGKFIYQEKGGAITEGIIAPITNENLWEMIEQGKLNNYKNSYLAGTEDTPPTIITYVTKHTNKQISFQQKAPEQLKKIVLAIKKIKSKSIDTH